MNEKAKAESMKNKQWTFGDKILFFQTQQYRGVEREKIEIRIRTEKGKKSRKITKERRKKRKRRKKTAEGREKVR